MKRNLIDKIVHLKLILTRAYGWTSLVNSGMIVFILVCKLQEKGLISDDLYLVALIYAIGVLLMVLIGILDRKFVIGRENQFVLGKNPEWQKLYWKVEKIEGLVEELAKEKKAKGE